jgi:hypothetical protein
MQGLSQDRAVPIAIGTKGVSKMYVTEIARAVNKRYILNAC